jgi:NitT/TauT family transport system substrate-binding protein
VFSTLKTPKSPPSSRRHALATIGVAVGLAPTIARAQTLTTIRVGGPPAEQALPLFYANRAGLFERAGIKLEISSGASGAATAAAVAAGGLDIGLSSMLAIILGHAHNIPLTIVAPSGIFVPESPAGLIVMSDSPLHVAKDFNGKTIAAAAVNDINSLGLWTWMDKNGGDSSTVKVVEIPQSAQPAALEQGRVDGITVSNPAFTVAMATGKMRFIVNIWNAMAPRLLLVCWFSTLEWVQRNRTIAERFGRVIAEAATYCNTHVPETVDDLVALSHLDRTLVLQMKRTLQGPTVGADEIQPMIDAAVKYKLLTKGFPASEIIAPTAQT